MDQWLGLYTSIAGYTGSIPGKGTKILQAPLHGQKNKNYKIKMNKYQSSFRIQYKTNYYKTTTYWIRFK